MEQLDSLLVLGRGREEQRLRLVVQLVVGFGALPASVTA